MKRNTIVAVAVVVLVGYLAIANGSAITNNTTSTTGAQTSTTVVTSSSSTGSLFTLQDELNTQGADVWEQEYYFPSLGTGFIIDEIRGSTSCPCQISSVSQQGQNVQITDSNGGITIVSSPSSGYERTTISSGFQQWAGMPGLMPGDIFEHWQTFSVFRFSGLVSPFTTPSASGYSSYGTSRLTRGGYSYDGFGVYLHITSQSISDPHPGFYFQFGWTPTNSYVLFTARSGTQDASAIAYSSGQVSPTSVTVTTNQNCSSISYSYGSNSLTYLPRFIVGTSSSCSGESFGGFTDNQGNSGTMWALTGR